MTSLHLIEKWATSQLAYFFPPCWRRNSAMSFWPFRSEMDVALAIHSVLETDLFTSDREVGHQPTRLFLSAVLAQELCHVLLAILLRPIQRRPAAVHPSIDICPVGQQ